MTDASRNVESAGKCARCNCEPCLKMLLLKETSNECGTWQRKCYQRTCTQPQLNRTFWSEVHSEVGSCAGQFSLSDATTAEVMVAARKLSVASAKAAAEIYASVRSSFEEASSSVPQLLQGIPFLPSR